MGRASVGSCGRAPHPNYRTRPRIPSAGRQLDGRQLVVGGGLRLVPGCLSVELRVELARETARVRARSTLSVILNGVKDLDTNRSVVAVDSQNPSRVEIPGSGPGQALPRFAPQDDSLGAFPHKA